MALRSDSVLVFDSWRRCMRVEVSNPPPAVWGSIPGLGIGGYARPFWPCAAMDLTLRRPKPTWAALRPRLRFGSRSSSPVWVMVANHLRVRVEVESIFWAHYDQGGSLSTASALAGVSRSTGYRWLQVQFTALREFGMSRAAAARQLRLSRGRSEQ
jgi:hypothetical protein